MAPDTPHIKPGGTLYLILIQVVSRGLTFAGNQALLRYVTPADLGLAVQLETLSISVLYTARESLRVALQRKPKPIQLDRQDEQQAANIQAAVNTAYLVLMFGLMLGGGLGIFYLQTAPSDAKYAQDFSLTFRLYSLATVVELSSEPAFLILQSQGLFKARAFAETTAAMGRCVGAVLTAWYMVQHGWAASAVPFAVGQLSYAVALLVLYLDGAIRAIRDQKVSILPRRMNFPDMVAKLIPQSLLSLATALYGQSIFKWLLTQGDTLVLSYFADLKAQGTFALASNYGGLASRLLFQPIEESSRTLFGRLLAGLTSDKNGPHDGGTGAFQGRKEALQYLSRVVRGYLVLVAFPCTTLLPRIFPLIIQILLGARSSFFSPRTGSLLATYSYYLPFLAVNGILDAFVTSIATEAELAEQSLAMAGVTMLYVSMAAAFMTQMGLAEIGLVYANIVNMSLRIMFSLWFIRSWIQQNIREAQSKALKDFVAACSPSKNLILAWTGITLLSWSEGSLKTRFGYLLRPPIVKVAGLPVDTFEASFIITLAMLLLGSLLLMEGEFILQTFGQFLPPKLRSSMNRGPAEKNDQ